MTKRTIRADPGESAEREAEAQLEIIRALRKLPDQDRRYKVMQAVVFILSADARVPGVFDAVMAGLASKKKGE